MANWPIFPKIDGPLAVVLPPARDTEVQVDELRTAMLDRAVWRTIVNGVSSPTR